MSALRPVLTIVLMSLSFVCPTWAQELALDPNLNFSAWTLNRSWLDEYEKFEKYWILKFHEGRLEYYHVDKITDRKSGQVLQDIAVTEKNLTPQFEKDLGTGLTRAFARDASGKEVFSLFVVDNKCLMFKEDLGGDPDDCFLRADQVNPCFLEQSFPLTYPGNYQTALEEFLSNGGNQSEGIVDFGNSNNAFRTPLSVKETILTRFPKRAFKDFTNDRAHRLEMGYKFSLSASGFPLNNCQLKVSQYEYKYDSDPAKNVHHHLLAGGESVHSAGAVFFFHDGKTIEKIFITNRSSRFCPSFESLQVIKKILLVAGIDESIIQLENGTRNGCQGN